MLVIVAVTRALCCCGALQDCFVDFGLLRPSKILDRANTAGKSESCLRKRPIGTNKADVKQAGRFGESLCCWRREFTLQGNLEQRADTLQGMRKKSEGLMRMQPAAAPPRRARWRAWSMLISVFCLIPRSHEES